MINSIIEEQPSERTNRREAELGKAFLRIGLQVEGKRKELA